MWPLSVVNQDGLVQLRARRLRLGSAPWRVPVLSGAPYLESELAIGRRQDRLSQWEEALRGRSEEVGVATVSIEGVLGLGSHLGVVLPARAPLVGSSQSSFRPSTVGTVAWGVAAAAAMTPPLAGLGWASAATPTPPGWTSITSTVEGAPATFGKGFSQKSNYFLCFASAMNSENPTGDVLSDVIILSEKSPLPSGYSYVKEFSDPKVSVSKKKRLCAKLIPLGTAEVAVFDIVLSSKSKVIPNYMRIGEMSGFAVWCKKDHISKPRPLPKPRNISLEMKQLSLEPNNDGPPSEKPAAPFGLKRQTTLKRHESTYESSNVYGISAMEGVPFVLHPKFESSLTPGTSAFSLFKDLHIKSLADIENEYNYGFVVERTAAARLPPTIS